MEAPRSTQFQWRARGTDVSFASWPNRDPDWDFCHYEYRIASTPKKVLRPLSEIIAIEEPKGTISSNSDPGSLVFVIDINTYVHVSLVFSCVGKTKVEIAHKYDWPDEWFTTDEAER